MVSLTTCLYKRLYDIFGEVKNMVKNSKNYELIR